MSKQPGKIFILSGPSGSGKTTLYQKLLADTSINKRLQRTVSYTTRAQRYGEQNGRDYFFISKKLFKTKQSKRFFLEHKKVFDNFYGTSKAQVNSILHKGKSVLLAIDVQGAKEVLRHFPHSTTIFVKTPNLRDLQKRLKGRGTENKETLKLRLSIAKKELKDAKNYQYVITNDKLASSSAKLKSIVLKELT